MDVVGKHTLEEMKGAQWYNEYVYDNYKKYLRGKILEIGAGIGNFTGYLQNSGSVTAIDVSREYIKVLKNTYPDATVGLGDVENKIYFFGSTKFDCAIALNVFEHIKNDKKALKNVYNLLKKGGNFVILVPAHMFLFSYFDKELGHYRRYSVSDLKQKLEEAGFKVQKIYYFNWWAAIGWWVFVKLFSVNKMPGVPVKMFDVFGKYFLWLEKYINPPFGLSVVAVCKK